VKDMYRIVVRWTELAPRVLRIHDHLFAGTKVSAVRAWLSVGSPQRCRLSFTHNRSLCRVRIAITEMYGLIFATHQLHLPFTLVKSFVLSETASRIREGWEYVDQLRDEEVCQPLSQIKKPLPVTLHYCERYGVWNCCAGCENDAINAHHSLRVRSCVLRLLVTCWVEYVQPAGLVSIEVALPFPHAHLVPSRSSSSQSIE
jgi:hypothetical protein